MLLSASPPRIKNPYFSIVVVMHNMQREAARTLLTMSKGYQRGIDELSYEVLVVDSNSSAPLNAAWVCGHGPQFGHYQISAEHPTPVLAMATGVQLARGNILGCVIDGARMLSPGCFSSSLLAHQLISNAFVYTPSYHLGEEPQGRALRHGYNQKVEDALLASFAWESDGYSLFDHAVLAGSCDRGIYQPFGESNYFTIERAHYQRLGGLDPRFVTAGGGYVNLDFYYRAMSDLSLTPVLLTNEGSFHQFHGGAASNIPLDHDRHAVFRHEYQSVRGHPFRRPNTRPVIFRQGCK